MPKLVAFGDIHLGQGTDLGRKPGDRLQDQADVLMRIADLAIEENVDGILCAGDVFEGPGIPPEHLDIFAKFIDRLQGRIPLLVVLGNGRHDAALRDVNGLQIFNRFNNVTIAAKPDLYRFAGCAVWTLPWVHPGRLVAARNGGDRDQVNEDVADLLLDIAARGLVDCARLGGPTILLGHWSVSGTSLPSGLPVDQLREPVIPADALEDLGFDHIVMGHIHRAQGFAGHGFYVGSPMPLNFGEDPDPFAHGVSIIHTDETEDIDFYAAEFRPIESPRFVTIDLESEEAVVDWGLRDSIARAGVDSELLDDAIVRVRMKVDRDQLQRADLQGIRETLGQVARSVKIVTEVVREQRGRVQGLDEGVDELAALDLYIDANHVDGELADRMRARTSDYLGAAA